MTEDVLKDAIGKDDLSQEDFVICDTEIMESEEYRDVMTEITSISRTMKWVQDYDRYPTRKFEYPFSYYAAGLGEDMRMLDAGCSTDSFAPFLASRGFRVWGSDNFHSHDVRWDPENGLFQGKLKGADRLKAYREMLQRQLNVSVDYHIEDICSTHFEADHFDRIFCISVLEHLPDYKIRMVFDEWRRILKKEGLVLLTVDYIVNGRVQMNIGRTLKKAGFRLDGKVNVFHINGHPVTVAGFAAVPLDSAVGNVSRIYRGNRVVREMVDTVYSTISRCVSL